MKNKRIIISFALILSFIIIPIICKAAINVEVKQTFRSAATINYTTDIDAKEIRVYKKNNTGKFILIFKKVGDGQKSGSITIPATLLSTEKATEFIIVAYTDEDKQQQSFTVDKIPEAPSMNPEETAKPSWSPSTLPTKPTPSTTSTAEPATSTSASASTDTSTTPETSTRDEESDPEPSKTGKTYYVATDGNDSNSGLESSKPLKKIQTGIDKLSAGDTLIIKNGTYNEKLSIDKKGTKEKPITITCQGTVKINGQGKGGILFKVKSGSQYVSINNLTFKNLNGNDARGVSIEPNTKHIAIYSCKFENIKCPHPSREDQTANAIYLEGSGNSEEKAIDYVTIKNCTLSKVCPGRSEGISVDGNCTNITIDKVTSTADGVETNIAICVCGNDDETNSNKAVNRPRNVKIKNCVVSGCKSPYDEDSYGIYVDGAYNVTIENNQVNDSQGGIEVGAEHKSDSFSNKETEKITVKDNTINNCPFGIYVGGFSEDSHCGYAYNVTITDNTITNCGGKEAEAVTFDRCEKVEFTKNTVTSKNKARIIYLRKAAKNLSFGNNKYSNGRSAGDDSNFGKEDSDYSFSKWKEKFNDQGSEFN